MLRCTNRQPPNPRDSETTPSGIGGRRTTSVESRWHLAGRRWLWTKIRWEFVRSCSSDAEERTSSVRCCSGFAQSCWEFGKSRLSFVKTRWDWRNSRRVFGDLSRGAAIQPQAGSHSSHRHRRLRPRDFHRHRRRMSQRDIRLVARPLEAGMTRARSERSKRSVAARRPKTCLAGESFVQYVEAPSRASRSDASFFTLPPCSRFPALKGGAFYRSPLCGCESLCLSRLT